MPKRFWFNARFKSAIFAIIQKSADSHDLLVQPSKTAHTIFLILILFIFFFLNMKPLSEVAPGLLIIQIQIQEVCFS